MATSFFINLPVRDLPRSQAFYLALGWTLVPAFTSEAAACFHVDGPLYVMLLTHGHFSQFTPKPIADARSSTAALLAVSCDSVDAAKAMCETAFRAGGAPLRDPQDLGFMFSWAFQDPDGHTWEPFWFDPAAAPPSPA